MTQLERSRALGIERRLQPAPSRPAVIDAQIHLWYTDRPSRPWIEDPWAGRSARARAVFRSQLALSCSAETALDEMATAGVGSAVLAPLGVYGFDNSIELQAAAAHDGDLFALIAIDHRAPDVAHRLELLMRAGASGVRFAPMDWQGFDRGEYDAALAAAAAVGCPIFLHLVHPVPHSFAAAIQRYPEIPFIIDHAGTGSAPPGQPAGREPFEHLPAVLRYADFPNVWLKLTALPALSRREFPFEDIWQPIRSIVSAFGADRVMWGSDFTRTNCLYSYRDGLDYLDHIEGLTAKQLSLITGGAVRRLLVPSR